MTIRIVAMQEVWLLAGRKPEPRVNGTVNDGEEPESLLVRWRQSRLRQAPAIGVKGGITG
jgi:hypothetical protein